MVCSAVEGERIAAIVDGDMIMTSSIVKSSSICLSSAVLVVSVRDPDGVKLSFDVEGKGTIGGDGMGAETEDALMSMEAGEGLSMSFRTWTAD